ncbi:MAG: energy transducer TonB [Gammaproteobacteria bacterium]|nr:energy transducer TonB [Gammaproteobacteria bacterium]
MEHLNISQWSAALLVVSAAHAGVWYGLSSQQIDYAMAGEPRSLDVSILSVLPQTKTVTPPVKQIHTPVVAKVVPVAAPTSEPVMSEPVVASAPAESTTQMADTAPVVQPARYNAAYLNNPPPNYPLAARRRHIEGNVLIRAKVQADGSCSHVELKLASSSDLLNQAALDAVKKWRFAPAMLGEQTITAWVEIPITFKLEN